MNTPTVAKRVFLALGVVVALLVVDVARIVVHREQLETAADAAALAAAPVTFADFGTRGGPVAAARAMAQANGASLSECSCTTDRSWRSRRVTVVVSGAVTLTLLGTRQLTASASAEFRPIALSRQ